MVNKIVTIMAIGKSGVGKSQNGCAFLQNPNAFETDSSPDSCTYKTSAQSNIINEIKRFYIDTQGLQSTDGLDAEYIKQMIDFLKQWENGINAFYIVINIQNPKFDDGVQKMLLLINDFFNDSNFWNQTGIIFTRCFPGYFDRTTAETKYRQLVIDFIKKNSNNHDLNPQMPCFFVDSVNWETDQSTKNEYIRIFEFAHKNQPVQTPNVKLTRPEYKLKEEEVLHNILVNTSYTGTGRHRTKILTYEDQKRFKITDWNNNITYTKPVAIKTWNETFCSKITEETKTETNENRTPISRTYHKSSGGFFNSSSSTTTTTGSHVVKNHQEYKRNIITDPDGNISYEPWSLNRSWTEEYDDILDPADCNIF
ncbi:hypothetical protein M9Y10_024883 [Tritrichomonas musculus]|uniref:AIG1-type G domain-containing protein n=1 Tax=Tritrichomonas musculus TaxID=1915356 RepID=A0ABR2HCF9_9EUKA